MTLTFDLILKILVSVSFAYIVLNSFLHYHFTFDRINLLFVLVILLAMTYFYDTNRIFDFLVTIIIVIIITGLIKYIFYRKKIFAYFLLNSYNKTAYKRNKPELMKILEEYDIAKNKLCYNENRPYILVLKNITYKQARSITKKMDRFDSKLPKKFTMFQYWNIIAFLVILVLIWRF